MLGSLLAAFSSKSPGGHTVFHREGSSHSFLLQPGLLLGQQAVIVPAWREASALAPGRVGCRCESLLGANAKHALRAEVSL